MRLVDANSAAAYLRDTGRVEAGETVRITELTGGVSNVVLWVRREGAREDFVLKQVRAQLRVAQPWFCSVERIWREIDVLEICQRVLAANGRDPASADLCATTPRLLFVDQPNYLFAMTAAPPHQVWKQQLLAGHIDARVAAACADLMGRLHAGTWQDREVAEAVGDRTFFEDLRVSPYYRHVAAAHPALQANLEQLIRSMDEHRLALVHGDFSPKNLLVSDSQVMLIDFEVGHFGDPAFDIGFYLTHLVLKALRARSDPSGASGRLLELTRRFWFAYASRIMPRVDDDQFAILQGRAILHLAACLLARVDGKSPVDYLDPNQQAAVRRVAVGLLEGEPRRWEEALQTIQQAGE